MEVIDAILNNPKNDDDRPLLKKRLSNSLKLGLGPSGVVKLIQAGHHLWQAAQDPNGLPKAINIIQETIPMFHVMSKSIADSTKVVTSFGSIATSLGTVGNMVVAYQGTRALNLIATNLKDVSETLQAQTALMSIEKFPQAVYDLVEEALHNFQDDDEFTHWFFVYHPDTIWTPGFHRLVTQRGLHRRFCGHSSQLDAAVVFMLAAREYAERSAKYGGDKRGKGRRVKMHLLIPAYQPVLLKDPVRFPDALGDFTIHGKIHNSTPLVWINLAPDQACRLVGVARWQPPNQTWLESMLSPAAQLPKVRELGRAEGTGK
jgi:hypothetical protein